MADRFIDDKNQFLLALGQAIAKWQWVETECYTIFAQFMKGAGQHMASVAFHHIQSFESRITLLDRCAYFAVPDKMLADRWKELKKRLLNQAAIRNHLVHFSFTTEHHAGKHAHFLMPSFMDAIYAIHDKWKNPNSHIDITKLRKANHDFDQLARDLHQWRDDFLAIAKKTARTKSRRSLVPQSSTPKRVASK